MNMFLPNIHRIIQGIDQNKLEWETKVQEYQTIMEKEATNWEDK